MRALLRLEIICEEDKPFVGQNLYLGGGAVYEQRMLTKPLIASDCF